MYSPDKNIHLSTPLSYGCHHWLQHGRTTEIEVWTRRDHNPMEQTGQHSTTTNPYPLPKMGINRHMPRAVVYGPEHFGGLGIQQLSVEQGLAHVQYTVGSLRARTNDYQAIYILLESFIIISGITGNPLENMMPTEYIESPWIETTRIFLHSINAAIIIPDLNTIMPYRINDKGIMELARTFTSDTKTLQTINNCRLFLQVHTLADITTTTGDTIHPEAYYGQLDAHSKPMLWRKTQSTL